MKLLVRILGVPGSEALREHAARRVALALGRYAPELTLVVVRVGDLNGPRGGADKRCHVTVSGRRIGHLEVENVGGDPYAAVSAGIDRVARATARRLERARESRGEPSIRYWHPANDPARLATG